MFVVTLKQCCDNIASVIHITFEWSTRKVSISFKKKPTF